jgi:hypothetical protein
MATFEKALTAIRGSAADEAVAGEAADRAQAAGALVGWVNKQMAELHPLGRTGSANEVAAAVA